jgi:hypothetical protein
MCILACKSFKIKNFNNIDINKLVEINCLNNESVIIIDKQIENFIINNKHNLSQGTFDVSLFKIYKYIYNTHIIKNFL